MPSIPLARALREVRRAGYRRADLRADLLAGVVVGIVALPLSIALAISSGMAPQNGLATAIVAGGLAALLGGSRVQVSGPTAAFVVLLAPVSARHGPAGLLLASALAGLVLIGMGALRLGRLVQLVPYPVTTGFTAGIGVVIASLQVSGFLGVHPVVAGDASWLARMQALGRVLPEVQLPELAVGLTTLAVLLVWRRVPARVPAPLVALGLGTVLALALGAAGFSVETLMTRFGTPAAPSGLPRAAPAFLLPWLAPGPEGAAPGLSLALLRELAPAAFAIAMLGAIESLLSAVVADGMTGFRHDPDAELMGLGLANLVAPFFGGFAATGAIARTATNVRSGGRSPIAALTHSAFVLAAVLLLAPALGYLPMASLAALLIVVAWNMAEARHFVRVLRSAPRGDAAVLLTCFALTVVFDMTIAVAAGVLLAALVFMRRMIEISGADLVGAPSVVPEGAWPTGLVLFDVRGPMFFGAAHKATSQLFDIDRREVRGVLLDVQDVPVIDATGVFNLASAVDRLSSAGIRVWLVGLRPQPREVLVRSGLLERVTEVPDLAGALEQARAALAHPG